MALDENYEQHIDSSTVSVMPTALRYGLIGALIMIALGLVLQVTGQVDYTQTGGGMLNNLIFYGTIIGVVVMAIKAHRDKDLGGYISYGRSLGVGTLAAVVLGIISSIWVFVQMTYISPEILDTVREAAMEQMAEQQGGDEEAMEAAQGIMEMMLSPGVMALMGVVTTAIVGFVISLIGGAILKKEGAGV